VDPVEQIRRTRELIDIDSTTGREGDAGAYLARLLRGLGYHVVEQPVGAERFNVFATPATPGAGNPRVVFSTHFDCVPPHFSSREESGRLYGRGACDAKGIAIAQIAAAERLRAAGETRIGLLFVVGEERGSDGAKLANTIAPGSSYLINGEPTDNRLGLATRGVYRCRLRAHGRAAHSSQPELGESAIEKLVDVLVGMRDVSWPFDSDLGRTYYTVGLIKGGVAPNVIPAEAEAEIMFRTVGDYHLVETLVRQQAARHADVDYILDVPPVRLKTVPGFTTAAFNFTTDIPFLDRWGTPLLLGPGSISLAHTADEYCEVAELHRAVALYVDLARGLGAELD
jgi:acetylornithine deacetylase